MANKDTLSIKPLQKLFMKYKVMHEFAVDPFARDCALCEITNDLNPATKAKFHMYAHDFLEMQTSLPFVVFDPPYSLRQVKECYDSFGVGFTHKDSQNAIRWTIERDIIAKKQIVGDRVLSLGWTSTCMGIKRGYEIEEIMLISHGPAHNDTIATVERKLTAEGTK